MGACGRVSDSSEHEGRDILKRLLVDPPFSLTDMKKAIFAHYFQRSVIRSSYYVVTMLFTISLLPMYFTSSQLL
nr:plastid delta12-fatty acid acetylenase [Tanacetum cinerariifolium]